MNDQTAATAIADSTKGETLATLERAVSAMALFPRLGRLEFCHGRSRKALREVGPRRQREASRQACRAAWLPTGRTRLRATHRRQYHLRSSTRIPVPLNNFIIPSSSTIQHNSRALSITNRI